MEDHVVIVFPFQRAKHLSTTPYKNLNPDRMD